MPGNLSHIIWKWMKSHDIHLSRKLLRQTLERHPDYPTALSVTETLEEFGIENLTLKVEREKLHEVPVPFLAHIISNGGDFRLISDPLQIKTAKHKVVCVIFSLVSFSWVFTKSFHRLLW